MTPGARIKAAIDLLLEIDSGKLPADVLMDSFFRGRRYVGARDRRAISDQVYSVIRRRTGLDWWIERAGSEAPTSKPLSGVPMMRARLIALQVLCNGQPADHMSDLFNGNRHCPDLLTAHERALAETLQGEDFRHPEMPDWVVHEYPDWLDSEVRDCWPEDFGRQMAALNEPAPLDLRTNLLKATRDEARAALAGEGVFAEQTPMSPLGLRLTGRTRLGGLNAFRSGLIEVQDEGSQILSLLTDVRPGMTVVDFCAGAGGKTLAMAASMGFRDGEPGKLAGRLVACDISNKRLRRMESRLERAGIGEGVSRRALTSERDRWIERNRSSANRVLVDAPCSGVGGWRRNPDQKMRLTIDDLASCRRRQRAILAGAAHLVVPGGRLIYATCSLLPSENEDQVARFLDSQPEFRALPIGEVWQDTVGGDCPSHGTFLNLTPADHGTDGFFCAVLERRI